jgi:ActR/RegA family two-component response regulator
VDSQDARRQSVASALARAGYDVRVAERLERIAHDARVLRPDLVIIGFSPDASAAALAAIAELQKRDPRLPILVIVSGGSEALAVSAFRMGVKDYFCDPLDVASVEASARRCLATAGPDRTSDGSPAAATPLIAGNGAMRHITEYLNRVAESDSTVLITGETGTGKELAATLVHERSRRRKARFVSMNCAAIPEGLLESELFGHESGAFTGAAGRREGLLQVAERGTVFLDEIGDMGAQAQAKILRAIESREVYRLGAKRQCVWTLQMIATGQDLRRAVGRPLRDCSSGSTSRASPPRCAGARTSACCSITICRRSTAARHAIAGIRQRDAAGARRVDWPRQRARAEGPWSGDLRRPAGARGPARTCRRVPCSAARPHERGAGGAGCSRAAGRELEQPRRTCRWSRMTVYRKAAAFRHRRGSTLPSRLIVRRHSLPNPPVTSACHASRACAGSARRSSRLSQRVSHRSVTRAAAPARVRVAGHAVTRRRRAG